jgi:hypothetical protein
MRKRALSVYTYTFTFTKILILSRIVRLIPAFVIAGAVAVNILSILIYIIFYGFPAFVGFLAFLINTIFQYSAFPPRFVFH